MNNKSISKRIATAAMVTLMLVGSSTALSKCPSEFKDVLSVNAFATDTFEAVTDGVTYYYTIDDGCKITGYSDDSTFPANFTIPRKLNGMAVNSIGNGAFSGAGFTTLTIPENVTSMGTNVFGGCANLKTVYFNTSSCSITYATAESDSYNEDAIFYNCPSLTKAVFSENVTSIPNGAFRAVPSLETVEFKANVTQIGAYAFYGCTSIEDVYLRKTTEAQWETVSIGKNNTPLLSENVKYHFAEGTIDDGGDDNHDTETVVYTVKYFVDGNEYKTQEYEAGKTIIPPTVPVKQGFNFKGWDNLPTIMPNNNITVSAIFEAVNASLKIRNSSMYNGKTVDYKSTITFYAVYENCNNIEWYVNGQIVSANADGSCTLKQVKDNVEIYCTAKDSNGNTIKSESETINVKHSIIDKLIAFFLGLFGLLPIFNQ